MTRRVSLRSLAPVQATGHSVSALRARAGLRDVTAVLLMKKFYKKRAYARMLARNKEGTGAVSNGGVNTRAKGNKKARMTGLSVLAFSAVQNSFAALAKESCKAS